MAYLKPDAGASSSGGESPLGGQTPLTANATEIHQSTAASATVISSSIGEHWASSGGADKDCGSSAVFADRARVMFLDFMEAYDALPVVPGFLDHWAKLALDPHDCERAQRLFGFDKPVLSDSYKGQWAEWQYKEVRLPELYSFVQFSRPMTSKELRGLPGLQSLGKRWQHYLPEGEPQSRILHLRKRVRTTKRTLPDASPCPGGETPHVANAAADTFLSLCGKGLNPKALPQNTPDLWKLAESIDKTYDDTKSLCLLEQSHVLANAIVVHRSARGANGQEWLYGTMKNSSQLVLCGGDEPHAESLQKFAEMLISEHDTLVASGEVDADFLGHNEGRHRFMSGRYSVNCARKITGARAWAEAAHKIQPIIYEILSAQRQGKLYELSGDDLVVLIMAFYQTVCLSQDKKSATSGDPEDADGFTRMSWYNAVNAAWSPICWALLGGHATWSGHIGRGAFALIMLGQSPKSRSELAAIGVSNAKEFDAAYEKLQSVADPLMKQSTVTFKGKDAAATLPPCNLLIAVCEHSQCVADRCIGDENIAHLDAMPRVDRVKVEEVTSVLRTFDVGRNTCFMQILLKELLSPDAQSTRRRLRGKQPETSQKNKFLSSVRKKRQARTHQRRSNPKKVKAKKKKHKKRKGEEDVKSYKGTVECKLCGATVRRDVLRRHENNQKCKARRTLREAA